MSAHEGLDSPNIPCPPGYYCPNGTLTADPVRNDTTLRPYPCKPGTYCIGGVGFDEPRVGNFLYAQPCTEGFYCELASTSPKGNGLCPPGFVCPVGTSVPVPTSPGTFAEMKGTVKAAMCLPGMYAPTIESVECYECPPGTQCPDDGTSEALICPPGTFRWNDPVGEDGTPSIVCRGCPQGRWSKNWELRSHEECTLCPPGITCPIEGLTNPCSVEDLPTPYAPTKLSESQSECLNKGTNHYYGYLKCPIDSKEKSYF